MPKNLYELQMDHDNDMFNTIQEQRMREYGKKEKARSPKAPYTIAKKEDNELLEIKAEFEAVKNLHKGEKVFK